MYQQHAILIYQKLIMVHPHTKYVHRLG